MAVVYMSSLVPVILVVGMVSGTVFKDRARGVVPLFDMRLETHTGAVCEPEMV